MTPARLKQLRQIAAKAKRGVMVQVVAAARPPTVLILGCVDVAHAKAIVRYIEAFDTATIAELLDEVENR